MEPQLEDRLTNLEARLDGLTAAVAKIHRYFKIALWVSIAMFVLPLLGLVIAIPIFIKSYMGALDGLL